MSLELTQHDRDREWFNKITKRETVSPRFDEMYHEQCRLFEALWNQNMLLQQQIEALKESAEAWKAEALELRACAVNWHGMVRDGIAIEQLQGETLVESAPGVSVRAFLMAAVGVIIAGLFLGKVLG